MPISSQESPENTGREEPAPDSSEPAEPQKPDEPAPEPIDAADTDAADTDAPGPPDLPPRETGEQVPEAKPCPAKDKPSCAYSGQPGMEGLGACRAGVATCTAQGWRCIGEVIPIKETCNGKDDDCDGTIDNGNPDSGADCTTPNSSATCKDGKTQCQHGRLICISSNAGKPEICNGKDDNCDGHIDEGNPGGGANCTFTGVVSGCEDGLTTCYKGKVVCRPIKAEICNGKDDNCDGDVDEGLGTKTSPSARPCLLSNSSLGRCRIGREYCESGKTLCLPIYTKASNDASCNGLDDDCDGLVDEDVKSGCVKTLAGPHPAFFDGVGKSAMFYSPSAMVWDAAQRRIYISERDGQRIRQVDVDNGSVVTIAGDGVGADTDGPLGIGRLHGPSGMAFDPKARVLYIADFQNHKIRRLSLNTGQLTTYAGSGVRGFVDVSGTSNYLKAEFNRPNGVALSQSGVLWVADTDNHAIRKIDTDGVVTMAGRDPGQGAQSGYKDGDAKTVALFNRPFDLLFDPANRLMIVELQTPVVRRYLHNTSNPNKGPSVETWLGNATMRGHLDGAGQKALFSRPYRLSYNNVPLSKTRGSLFIADFGNDDIRTVQLSGDAVTTTVGQKSAGKSPVFDFFLREPTALLADDKDQLFFFPRRGILFRADWSVSPNKVLDVAGQNPSDFVDADRDKARFRLPKGIVADGSVVYVADRDAHRIRLVTSAGEVSTLLGSGTDGRADHASDPLATELSLPMALAFDATNRLLYIAQSNGGIRRYDLKTKATMTLVGKDGLCRWVSVVAGTTPQLCMEPSSGADDRPTVQEPEGIAVDVSSGKTVLYVADTKRHRIVSISDSGGADWRVANVAGSINQKGTSDGTGTGARFFSPKGLAIDKSTGSTSLFVADTENHCIRKIEVSSSKVSTYAGECGARGWVDQAAGSAKFRFPVDLKLKIEGGTPTLYVTDTGNFTIRKINSYQRVSTLLRAQPSGTTYIGGAPPGHANGPLDLATTSTDAFLALGASGQIFVSDTNNYAIRVILPW